LRPCGTFGARILPSAFGALDARMALEFNIGKICVVFPAQYLRIDLFLKARLYAFSMVWRVAFSAKKNLIFVTNH
jgi:hypothetical protein